MIKTSLVLHDLVDALYKVHQNHAPNNNIYQLLKKIAKYEICSLHNQENGQFEFARFGILKFPFQKLGNIDSTNLFDLDELILYTLQQQLC